MRLDQLISTFLFRRALEQVPQLVDEGPLPLANPLRRLVESEPLSSVHLGKLSEPARTWWPLEREGVAFDVRRIAVGVDCEGVDNLAARLLHRRKGREATRESQPGFLSDSRFAAWSGSSPGSNSPFGMDQEPMSFAFQKGPPGWTRKTCHAPWDRR
jgi:hypothetical protein